MGVCPIFGIWQGAGTPATSQMRCWLLRRHKLHIPRPAASGRSRPFRCASSQNRNRVAGLRFCVFCARWRNVGFSRCAAHTLAVGAESRTRRRHAAHGAVQAVCPPTGSIGTIISTVGRSAPSTLFRQMRRSPLLFRNETKMPFSLRAATLSSARRVIFFGVIPRLPSGSIFADSADGEPRYVESARSNSEKRCTS